tara:strand:+ start:144 stop:428 length:285 start_codon:yes stop_codon:yes gene_type:complete
VRGIENEWSKERKEGRCGSTIGGEVRQSSSRNHVDLCFMVLSEPMLHDVIQQYLYHVCRYDKGVDDAPTPSRSEYWLLSKKFEEMQEVQEDRIQ